MSVDYRAVAALIIKTAGLLLALYTLVQIPDRVVGHWITGDGSAALFVGTVLAPILLPLGVAWVLFVFPSSVARSVVGTSSVDGSELRQTLQPVIFSSIGLFLALQGALTLIYYATYYYYAVEANVLNPFSDPTTHAHAVSSGFTFAVGVALFLGGRGLSNAVLKLRNG